MGLEIELQMSKSPKVDCIQLHTLIYKFKVLKIQDHVLRMRHTSFTSLKMNVYAKIHKKKMIIVYTMIRNEMGQSSILFVVVGPCLNGLKCPKKKFSMVDSNPNEPELIILTIFRHRT